MANSECNKCHKPLSKGKKCDACRQKEKDSMKAIGKGVLAIGGLRAFSGACKWE